MDPKKKLNELRKKSVRFDELLSLPFSKLDWLFQQGKLTSEEISLFQDDYFYYLYIRHNYHPEWIPYESSPLLFAIDVESWQQLVKREEILREIEKRLHDPNLPKDIRLMTLLHLSGPELITFCDRNKSDSLCSNENSELWKTLYFGKISAIPPRTNEFITDSSNFNDFFRENSLFHERLDREGHGFKRVSYKTIYLLFLDYVNENFILLVGLGSENVLGSVDLLSNAVISDIFTSAALNNHMHIIELILPNYLNSEGAENYAAHKIIINQLIERGFFEMALYLHNLSLEFDYDLRLYEKRLDEFYKSAWMADSEAYKFIVKHLLSSAQRLRIFKRFLGFEEFRQDKLDFILSFEEIDITSKQKELFTLIPPSVERYQWLLERIEPDMNVLQALLVRMRGHLEAYKRAKKDFTKFEAIIRLLYLYIDED